MRARGDGDVVEQAEAHRAIPLRVMAGRPHERERRLTTIEHMVRRLHRGSRSEERDLV